MDYDSIALPTELTRHHSEECGAKIATGIERVNRPQRDYLPLRMIDLMLISGFTEWIGFFFD